MILSITLKITTPTPSLNNDSPAIVVSNDLGVFVSFRIPKTAIGSVGDISEPNKRQYM